RNAMNPDSNGETYNWEAWKSNVTEASCAMQQDWRDYTGSVRPNEYLKSKNYKVAPATTYAETSKSDELEVIWNQVTNCITTGSWKCIYAQADGQFNMILKQMINDAKAYGYDKCIEWCEENATIRHQLEEANRQ
ncbi:MAG: hypothetical protein IJ420_05760, partial [Lachnospiraceae bacterium]|nr:hypothetical protein [Lachnospiraceae bacterium]